VAGLLMTTMTTMAAMPALAQDPAPAPAPAPVPASASSPSRHPEMFLEERFWLGYARPDAHDAFWRNDFAAFDVRRDDLQGLAWGTDAVLHLDRYNAVALSLFGAVSDTRTRDRAFSDDDRDRFARPDMQFSVSTIGLAYMLYPAGTHVPVMPYLGAGVGLNAWQVRERGDFVDGGGTTFRAHFDDSGVAPGFFFLAGLEVPVSRWIAVIVDGRYNKAHDDVDRDFAGGGRIDLSGFQVGAGVALHF
jgi:opacity protein-like surface antigen